MNFIMALIFSLIWLSFEVWVIITRKGIIKSFTFYNLFLALSFIVFFVAAVALSLTKVGSFSHNGIMYSCAGAFVFLVGVAIRLVSYFTLGEWFSLDISSKEKHLLIQSGIYRSIRHPSYSGAILICAGICLMILNWFLLTFALIWFTALYSIRIEMEEKILIERFGEDYVDYQRRTKSLIPFLY